MPDNHLYYGDPGAPRPRRHVKDDSGVPGLVYLDPPFKRNQDYLGAPGPFAKRDGTRAAAQIKTFEDTWRWDRAAAEAFHEVVEAGGQVAGAIIASRTFLGKIGMLAYLANVAPRVWERHHMIQEIGFPSFTQERRSRPDVPF